MKKIAYLAAALFGLAALGQAGAHAGIVNAGFETGDLTGWTAIYDHGYYNDPPWLGPLVRVEASETSAYSGTDYAVLEAGASQGAPTILSQTFFLHAGETINGAVDFLPFVSSCDYRDYASVTINGVTLYSAEDGHITTASLFKWTPYSFTAPSADWYTLTASITAGDSSSGGLLYFDAVEPEPSASAVPEPSTWAMMLLGFAGLGFAAFRHGRKTSTAIA